jgi:hypothetical protein
MKSWVKIAIKLVISIVLFFVLSLLFGGHIITCMSTLGGSGAQAGCFAKPGLVSYVILFLISILIVWLADWLIEKLKK